MKQTDDILIPHYHYERADKITVQDILSWGVKAVAVDIDNTICYDATTKFLGDCEKWINNIRQSGLPVIILSNATTGRANRVAKKAGLRCISMANKPAPDGFLKAAEMLDLKVEEIAFIGDQVFSDVKGANAVGGVSVLVDPAKTEYSFYFFYKYRRWKEKPVRKLVAELEKQSGVPHKVKEVIRNEHK